MPKGNEDLKAKIARIQQKSKAVPAPTMPTPEPEVLDENTEMPEADDEESMEALEAEFEARKKALQQKAKPAPAPVADQGIEQAIVEYADDGKFRVELIFQLVQLNKSMKEIADAMKKFAQQE